MTIYRERVLPGPLLLLSVALVIPASLLVFLPINAAAGVVVAIVLFAAILGVLFLASPVIEVSETGVTAGRARLPLEHVGVITAYTRADARQQRGPLLDARAWLVIRGWADPVVKLDVEDDRDPVPYWLISTRRPAAFIDAVAQARSRH